VTARLERFVAELVYTRPPEEGALSPELLTELDAMRDEVHAIMRRADDLIAAARPSRKPPRPEGPGVAGPALDGFFGEVFDLLEPAGVNRPAMKGRPNAQFSSGPFGSFWIWPRGAELRVGCYLDTRHADAGNRAVFNEELFSLLLAEEDEIQSVVGEDLVWDELPGRQSCWIGLSRPRPDLDDPADRAAAAAWAADALERLLLVLEPRARAHAAELIRLRRSPALPSSQPASTTEP